MIVPTFLIFLLFRIETSAAVERQYTEFVGDDCPEDGYFPSVTSCRAYTICFKGFGTTYQCKSILQVYSPTTKSCVKKSLRNKCFQFRCLGKSGKYVAYAGDPTIYAFCNMNTAEMLQKCTAGKEFDEKQQTCTIICHEEGNKLDPDDCTRFYECSRTLGINNYVIKSRKCPPDSWFNSDLHQCTGVGIEACPQAAPTTPTIPNTQTTPTNPTTPTTQSMPTTPTTPITQTTPTAPTTPTTQTTPTTPTTPTTQSMPTTPTTPITQTTPTALTTPTTQTTPSTPTTPTTQSMPTTPTTPTPQTTPTTPTPQTTPITQTTPTAPTTPATQTTPTTPTPQTTPITPTTPATQTTPTTPTTSTPQTTPTTPTTPTTQKTSTTPTGIITPPWGN